MDEASPSCSRVFPFVFCMLTALPEPNHMRPPVCSATFVCFWSHLALHLNYFCRKKMFFNRAVYSSLFVTRHIFYHVFSVHSVITSTQSPTWVKVLQYQILTVSLIDIYWHIFANYLIRYSAFFWWPVFVYLIWQMCHFGSDAAAICETLVTTAIREMKSSKEKSVHWHQSLTISKQTLHFHDYPLQLWKFFL